MQRRTFIGAGTVATLGTLSGCLARGIFGTDEESTETVERSFPAPDVETVRVTNDIGNVTIAATGTGDVDVSVQKRARNGQDGLDGIEVDIALEDGALTVETAIENTNWFTQSGPHTDVSITVPEEKHAPAIESVESDIGNVRLLGTRGDTTVRTKLGEVTASGVDGYLSLTSELGTILASDATGLRKVHTELGDVKADLMGLRDDVDISTELGSIVLGVADDLDLNVVVETTGTIDSNLPLTDGQTASHRLTGRQNEGGHRLHVVSELGEVSLRSIQR